MTLLRRSPALSAIVGAFLVFGAVSVWALTGQASAGDSEKLEASLLSNKLERVEAQVSGLQDRVASLEAQLAKSKAHAADRFAGLLDKFWEHRKLLLQKIAAAKASNEVITFEKDWDHDWGNKDWGDWDHDWGDKDWGDWDHGDWDHKDHDDDDGWDHDD